MCHVWVPDRPIPSAQHAPGTPSAPPQTLHRTPTVHRAEPTPPAVQRVSRPPRRAPRRPDRHRPGASLPEAAAARSPHSRPAVQSRIAPIPGARTGQYSRQWPSGKQALATGAVCVVSWLFPSAPWLTPAGGRLEQSPAPCLSSVLRRAARGGLADPTGASSAGARRKSAFV
jgi:hypothetical protein